MIIYLAATETQIVGTKFEVKIHPDANLFLTFYYPEKTMPALKFLQRNQHQGIITIDSGAHSFFSTVGISATTHKKKTTARKSQSDPEAYFKSYVKFLVEYQDTFDYFVELDIQELIGMETVLRWRKELKTIGLAKKMIPVYHFCEPMSHFEKIVAEAESRYIGIEGLTRRSKNRNHLYFVKKAYEAGCKIHGFAFTKQDLLVEIPFYSCDSSSWTAPIRYGTTVFFDKARGRLINGQIDDAESFLQHRISAKVHKRNRCPEGWRMKLEQAMKAYMEYEEYITSIWKERGIEWK